MRMGVRLSVPKDAHTIQEAIDKAQGDDTVLVSPGRYNESINFNGKAITLKSEKGPGGHDHRWMESERQRGEMYQRRRSKHKN